MAWHIVEKLIDDVQGHSTMFGKYWTTFFFTLRFLMILSIANPVFDDEREEFSCNTLTPGCENICFNEFNPLSLIRLWQLQVLAVAIQGILFVIYLAHKNDKVEDAKEEFRKQKAKAKRLHRRERMKEKILQRRYTLNDEHTPTGTAGGPGYITVDVEGQSEDSEDTEDDEIDKKLVASKMDSYTPPKVMLLYVFQVVTRLLIECVFIYFHCNLYVYKFWVPEVYKCSRYPCKDVVPCYVGRSKEKTILLWIMFSTSLIMIILSLCELVHIGYKNMWTAWSSRKQDFTKTLVPRNQVPSKKNRQTPQITYAVNNGRQTA